MLLQQVQLVIEMRGCACGALYKGMLMQPPGCEPDDQVSIEHQRLAPIAQLTIGMSSSKYKQLMRRLESEATIYREPMFDAGSMMHEVAQKCAPPRGLSWRPYHVMLGRSISPTIQLR